MFLILNGARFALAGRRAKRIAANQLATPQMATEHPATEPVPAPASTGSDSLTVYVWTPTGHATTPARQRLIRRYIAAVNARGIVSTGHAALAQGTDLYISHYPAVELDRSTANLRSSLRAGPRTTFRGGSFHPTPRRPRIGATPRSPSRSTASTPPAPRVLGCLSPRRHLQLHQPQLLDHGGERARCRGGGRLRADREALATPRPGAHHAGILGRGPAAERRRRDDVDAGAGPRLQPRPERLLDPVSPVREIAWKGVGRRLVRNLQAGTMADLYRIVRRRPAPSAGPTEA